MNESFLASRYENEWSCLTHHFVLISCILFHASRFLRHPFVFSKCQRPRQFQTEKMTDKKIKEPIWSLKFNKLYFLFFCLEEIKNSD